MRILSVTLKTVFLTTASALVMTSCDPENPDHHDQPELITTLRITATNINSPQDVHLFDFSDPDGDGGNAPLIDSIVLSGGVYNVQLDLLNESVDPVESLTFQIEEEGDEHQFFYTVGDLPVSVEYTDEDVNGDPLGLNTQWIVGGGGSGTLRITLKHQPGIKDGNIATGDTDIEIDFPFSSN